MKIVGIERFPITLQPAGKGLLQSDHLPPQTIIIVLRTDTGLTGLGEAAIVSSDDSRTLLTLLNWLKVYESALIGADAVNINAAHYVLDRASGQHPPGCQTARAAIDMALHDVIGKARGCPVHEILGGAYRSEIELCTKIVGETPEAAVTSACAAVNRRYRGLRIGIGGVVLPPAQLFADVEKKCQLLLAVLEAVGTDISVVADANQSLGNPALVSRMFESLLAKRMYTNLSLQQPLHKSDLKGHAFLRERLRVPVVLSESVISVETMMQIELTCAADRIELSIERVGGLSNAIRIADICEAAAIGIIPAATSYAGIGLAADCHLAVAIRDPFPLDIGKQNRLFRSPVLGGPEIRDGLAELHNAPGLGVELDEDLLHAMRTKADVPQVH